MERIFAVFWLILIPAQLGRHFWLRESSVMGVRVDYLSIIFYLTDLMWLGWIIKNKETKKILNSNFFNFKSLILIFFIGINIILATAKWVALYRWLRIGQWWLTIKLLGKNKDEITGYLIKIVPWWIVVEAFLGLAQIVKGGSLNGIWWWLGERRFSYGGIGIAQFRVFDQAWIRAYGTFSHPNSLAGFLLLAWWFFKSSALRAPPLKKGGFIKVWYWIVNWSAVMGIALSGSRIVWGLTIGLLVVEEILKTKPTLPSLDKESKKKHFKIMFGKILLFIGIICIILGVISVNYRISDFLGGWDTDSIEKRELLAISAMKMIKKNPLFGVGAGNFVVNLPKYRMGNFYWMQPVHNILLLAWSEIGILGIFLLIFNLQPTIIKLIKNRYWWLWVIVGITGLFDHYWLTLPQNFWLLAIVLGLI